MFFIKKFAPEDESDWNNFVSSSKNGTFLLNRSYMDYHKDRFMDFSIMIYRNEKELYALLPACLEENKLISHGGLSYGGFVINSSMKQSEALQILSQVLLYFKDFGIQQFIYKDVPSIYHTLPAEEFNYALFRHQALLFRRDVSTAIDFSNVIPWSKGRKALLSIAKKSNILIYKNTDIKETLEVATENLENKYKKSLVHSFEEMNLLQNRFPENIICISAKQNQKFLCGTILFITKKVIHAQYIANTIEGKQLGAFELILDHVINQLPDKKYFDFGISTEQEAQHLNEGLQAYKESFGARTLLFNHYQLAI